MRQLFLRLAVAPALLTLACATAINEGVEGEPLDGEGGTSSGGSLGGSLVASGTGGGNSSSGSTSMSNGGKSGSSTGAFGGTTTAGSTGEGGKSGSGGKSGTGGSATAGSSAGGKGGSSGSGNGGSGTAGTGGGSAGGPGSTTCDGVPDWSMTTYKVGDTVASTCSGVFAGTCPPGQSHKFECNPAAGVPALPWCTSREPGVGNGWAEAWVDKGQCQ
jgi:hypothetical protein